MPAFFRSKWAFALYGAIAVVAAMRYSTALKDKLLGGTTVTV